MNNINILSPKIIFPIVYLLLNLIAIDTMSVKVFAALLVFFVSYFIGVLICSNLFKIQNFNRLSFSYIFDSNRSLISGKFTKWCAIIYCSTIIIQFFRVGIGNTDIFRSIWLDDIPMGQYIMVFFSIGTQVFIYLITLRYIQRYINVISFLIISLVVCVSISLLGSRTAISIILFIQLSLLYLSKKITTNRMILLSIIMIFLMVIIRVVTILYGNDSVLNYYLDSGLIGFYSPWETLMLFVRRTLVDMAIRTQMVIDNIPSIIDYTYGKSLFFSYYSILPGEQVNPTILLNHHLFLGSTDDVGYPPTIAAQIYLDFGFAGLMIIPMLIGYIYTYVFYKARMSGHFFYIYLYIAITYSLLLSCYGEFLTFSIILFMLFYLVRRILLSMRRMV